MSEPLPLGFEVVCSEEEFEAWAQARTVNLEKNIEPESYPCLVRPHRPWPAWQALYEGDLRKLAQALSETKYGEPLKSIGEPTGRPHEVLPG